MFNLKVLLLAFLLLTTEVFAVRINYSAKFQSGSEVKRTSKNGKTVPDDKEQDIISNMGSWSEDKYSASKSAHGFIQVINVKVAASKGEGNDEVKEMESIVKRNIK